MKHHLLFCGIILSLFSFSQEHLNSTYTDFVYVDSTNVRDSPSISGKIIGKLNQNSIISGYSNMESVEGKVGGVSSSWQPIRLQGKVGYIWQPNLADGYFKSESDLNVHFLLNFTPHKGLEFKVFRNNTFISSHFFENKAYKEINGSVSLGTTFNSNGKEVIAVSIDNSYDLFEWDGTALKKSEIQLADDSFITGRYSVYKQGIINANKVNVRTSPKRNASISETLDASTLVELAEKNPIEDTIQGKRGYWYGIIRNGKTGYVWSNFIDVPRRYVKSNKVKDESFLYTTNAIYVLKQSELVHRTPIENTVYYYSEDREERNNFIQFGNRGLNSDYQFLGICYASESCGEAGGDNLYLWDGKKMTHFANDFSVGDGGYSSGHSYTFPNQLNGIRDRVIFEEEESEYADYDNESEENNSFIFSYARYEMQFNGDSLVEIESIHSKSRAFLQDTFPEYNLLHSTFSDLNQDGIEDVAFAMSQQTDEQSDSKPSVLIGVAFGNASGTFQDLKVNRSLVKSSYHSISFKSDNDTLEVRVNYHIGYDSDEMNIPSYSKFTFVYDTTYHKLIWFAKQEAEVKMIDERSAVWEIKNRERFKKNKVAFENAWEK
jgi:hypothetical protein